MIVKNVYCCEKCGCEYSERFMAEDCERSHIKPKEIINSIYHDDTHRRGNYPDFINVIMEDGEKFLYKKYGFK